MSSFQQRDRDDVKVEALRLLDQPGCPVCTRMDEGLERYFFWLSHEHYNSRETEQLLCQSYGFCPRHTRHFLACGASWCCRAVYLYITTHVISRLHKAQALLSSSARRKGPRILCRMAATVLAPRQTCPACLDMTWCQDYATHLLLRALADKEVQQAYAKSSGLCFPHFRLACFGANWDACVVLTDHMRDTLAALGEPRDNIEASMSVLTGLDLDQRLRSARHDERAPAPLSSRSETLTLIAEPSCPVCTVCERTLRGYFHWLAGEIEGGRFRLVPWDPAWNVCPRHLGDFRSLGYARAAAVAAQAGERYLHQLGTLEADLKSRQPARLGARLAAVPSAWSHALRKMEPGRRLIGRFIRLWQATIAAMESPAAKLTRLLTIRLREKPCQACLHVEVITYRTLDLVLRILEDPVGRQAYREGWGLCFRHLIAATKFVESLDVLNELLAAQAARLRLLEWELEESSRKASWAVRYESKGLAENAWSLAACQFCGSSLRDAAMRET